MCEGVGDGAAGGGREQIKTFEFIIQFCSLHHKYLIKKNVSTFNIRSPV